MTIAELISIISRRQKWVRLTGFHDGEGNSEAIVYDDPPQTGDKILVTDLDLMPALIIAVEALDLATDLLPVPERNQDEEWHEKEQKVYQAFEQIKSILKGGEG